MENENYKLPENAGRELKEGEEYKPLLPAGSSPKEATVYSVLLGVLMTVIFSAAAAYLGLKVGQVFEAAILNLGNCMRLISFSVSKQMILHTVPCLTRETKKLKKFPKKLEQR